jgi:tetratricopeptide (TPR) repeat protein
VLYRRGEYTHALALLQESAARRENSPTIQFHLGMALYMTGQEERARAVLQAALQAAGEKDFPPRAEAAERLALLNLDTRTAGPAVVAGLEERLPKDAADPVVASRLGGIYERDGQAQKAAKVYESALKQNPENAELLARLAGLYAGSLNDRPRALELATEAHKVAGDDPDISRRLGHLVYLQGDYQRALSLLHVAAGKISGQPDLSYELAWAYYRVGKIAEAEATMQTVVQAGADFGKSADAKRFVALVGAARDSAPAPAAVEQAQAVLKAEPDYTPALMVSARAQKRQGNFAGAKQMYERMLAANPLFVAAARDLAILLSAPDERDNPKAYELATKAREAYPLDPELARALGLLVYRRAEYLRAVQLLKESARSAQDDPELMYYLGMAHYQLKERKESKAALERVLALNAPPKLAADARRVLAQLH